MSNNLTITIKKGIVIIPIASPTIYTKTIGREIPYNVSSFLKMSIDINIH